MGEVGLALDRWLAALNNRGEPLAVAEALSADAEVLRHGWGADREVVKERIVGHEAISVWLRRSPVHTVFSARPPARSEAGGWAVRYEVRVEDFCNQGSWRFWLDGDGRIRRLEHLPDELPPPDLT